MKSMLISLLIVAVLMVLALKVFFKGETSSNDESAPNERFLKSCVEVSANLDQPEAYCRCLWKGGVRNIASLATSPKTREVVVRCGGAP